MLDSIQGLCWGSNQNLIFTASSDKTTTIFDIIQKQKIETFDFIHTSYFRCPLEELTKLSTLDTIHSVKTYKNDDLFVSCSVDQSIAITDLNKKVVLKRFEEGNVGIYHFFFLGFLI